MSMKHSASNKRSAARIQTFYLLDFDRCLGRTDALHALLEKTLESWPMVDLTTVRHAHDEARRTGGSFDTANYIRQLLDERYRDGGVLWKEIETAFLKAALRHDMLKPHAGQLLNKLDAIHARYGILTFGGPQWQTVKIKAAGLAHIPHMIVSSKKKGRLIASWQKLDGTFSIPKKLTNNQLIQAENLVLIDDKPVSFEGIPQHVKGICVLPTTSKIVDLPPNVTVVDDMLQASELLFAKNTTLKQ